MQIGKSQKLYTKAKKIIPGGTQLLSKRPEMFLPDYWPAYFSKAKGCEVWDLDNKHYYDFAYMGVGANLLGYANDIIDQKVIESIHNGTNSTLNCPEEIDLAEKLISLHPWSDMVRYTKTGGEAMSVAVRIARAHTHKEKILFCGYHGWHDWYIASNLSSDSSLNGHLLPGLSPAGVPQSLEGTSFPFTYNDTEGFKTLFESHKGELACIVMEPVRNHEPSTEFLTTIRTLCTAYNIVLIVDEITAGFRMNIGGAHLRYDFEPDIATFGKAFSNGYPMGAIIGKRKIMEAAQGSFISSLFWTERTGLTAALATIKEMESQNTPDTIMKVGTRVKNAWLEISESTVVPITITGLPSVISMSFDHEKKLELKTLLTQEMLKRGFLATTAFYACSAHEPYIDHYLDNLKAVFQTLKIAIDNNTIEASLLGEVCHAGFKRLT
ncbi:aminotransferase class III-fold pyridoxal phosphate-dependent enzyme [Lentisphaera profundi]|uniref:Aminotransferase class III-fold pyridoxal phosphate-dependent enzyme n=1 Tax=Lentisphaera profundi TaxID=1658616 RepID=A0ABY7VVE2_9BACT|nr:aminotransferase class III-fold pyridoxal phosphate-dependent enzyme [Lentisphaera profundi]WDE98195.1 aminotransferase class III-fold pyridoxal phosphate-dependent enzyme [Lentisphaera profundi]